MTRGDGETFRNSFCTDGEDVADNGTVVTVVVFETTTGFTAVGEPLDNGDKVFLFKEGAIMFGPFVITDVDVVTAGDVIEHVVLVLSVVTVTEAVERAQMVVVGDVLVAVVEARVFVMLLFVEGVVTVTEYTLLHAGIDEGRRHDSPVKNIYIRITS